MLSTKFFPPPAPGILVSRSRLIDRMMAGLRCPLTLVSAPAGFGKSTLLSDWRTAIQQAGLLRVGWLSLESQDNAPAQFWGCFVDAWLRTVQLDPEAPEVTWDQLQSLLKTDDKRITSLIAGELVHLMLLSPVPVVIILDDYHHIQSPEINESMTQLIERLPEHVRLAVATRFDPPLPVPRLRVRDQLSEIRAADLRFTGAEILDLFSRMPGIEFLGQDIDTIQASTEGWAAGLKMAALALQMQPRSGQEARRFWESFTGRNVYILDYLTEEVLVGLPEETQTFLMKTSLLDRLTGELCAKVVFDQEQKADAARVLLEDLERRNLFLIPLDQERRWFRYHHLFADLLRVRLQQWHGDEISLLHERAASWYEHAGLIEGAMRHAAAAGAWQRAARLVEEHAHEYLDRGELAVVLKWIETLPDDILRSRPNLCIQMAWAMGHAGRTHLVGPMLQAAEAALHAWEHQKDQQTPNTPVHFSDRDAVRVKASLAFHRAYRFVISEQPEQGLRLAENALMTLPDLETRERAWLTWVKGYALRGLGDLDGAAQSYAQAVAAARAGGREWIDLSIDLGIAFRLGGRLEEAGRVFEDCLQISLQDGQQNKGNLSRVEAYLSAVRMEQNRVEDALRHAQAAVDYLQWWPSYNHMATAHAFSALALLFTGKIDDAARAVEQAQQARSKGEVTPFVVRLVEMAQVRLWLAREDVSTIKAWADTQPEGAVETFGPAPFSEYEEMHLTTLARAWIGIGRMVKNPQWIHRALRLLEVLAASADARHRVNAAIEINLLAALACWEVKKTAEALDWLTRSLARGLLSGYQRVYLDEGPVFAELMLAWLAKDRNWLAGTNVDINAARNLFANLGLSHAGTAAPSALVEPLTEREKDILHLLALGLSNREMAERLVISEGTVKSHVHNLIGKLGAQSRTHVLARAKEFQLI